jgi:hypothetical protein
LLINVLLAALVATVTVEIAAVVIQTVTEAVLLLALVTRMVMHPPLSQRTALPDVRATKADTVSTVDVIPPSHSFRSQPPALSQ